MAARALVAGGTAASATTASAARAVRLFMIGASTLGTDCHRHALQHTTSLVVTRWVHAVIDGEVAANEVSPHGGIFLR